MVNLMFNLLAGSHQHIQNTKSCDNDSFLERSVEEAITGPENSTLQSLNNRICRTLQSLHKHKEDLDLHLWDQSVNGHFSSISSHTVSPRWSVIISWVWTDLWPTTYKLQRKSNHIHYRNTFWGIKHFFCPLLNESPAISEIGDLNTFISSPPPWGKCLGFLFPWPLPLPAAASWLMSVWRGSLLGIVISRSLLKCYVEETLIRAQYIIMDY